MTLPQSDEQIIRYLLGEMNEEELSVMEQHIEHDAGFFELITSVEDELIMRYVRGDMDEDIRPRFEKAYLAMPERRARIESARKLRAAVQEVAATRRAQPQPKWFFANTTIQVALVVLVVAAGTLWTWWRLGPAKRPALAQVSLNLEPGRDRSGSPSSPGKQFVLTPATQEVHFWLKAPESKVFGKYQIVVGTPERPAVFQGPAKPEAGGLSAVVPAKLLTLGDYTLELQGVGPDGKPQSLATYYFRSAR